MLTADLFKRLATYNKQLFCWKREDFISHQILPQLDFQTTQVEHCEA